MAIVDSIQDARMRYHGQRLLYELHPELLSPEEHHGIEELMWERLLMDECPKGKWTSLTVALADTEAMILEDDPAIADMLNGLRGHLMEKIAQGRSRQGGPAGV